MRIKSYIYSALFVLISLFTIYLVTIKILLPDEKRFVKTFVVTSGSLGGNYYKAGEFIAQQLSGTANEHYVFQNIPSDGSMENLARLKNRYADFAIVQRDELIKSYHGEGEKLKNVTVISPLFQEKLLIYSQQRKNISFGEFGEYLSKSDRPIRIGVTSKHGSTYKTFMAIADLLSLSTDGVEFVENDYDQLINDFRSHRLDFVLTLSLPIAEIENEGASYVYFDEEDILLLTNRMRYFSNATVSDDPKYKTVGVWALLIGLNSSVEEIGDDVILRRLTSKKAEDKIFSQKIRSTQKLLKNDPLMYEKYLSTLPVAPALLDRINKNPLYSYWYLIPITLVFLLAAYYFRKLLIRNSNELRFLWIRYNHIFIGSLVVVVCYLLCIEFLIYNEEVFFNSTGVKSRILDLPRSDLHVWNTLRMFAQIDGGVFPYSLYGKLLTALSTYLTLFGAIAIALSEYGMYKWTAKRRGGRMKIDYEGHVIVSGWNNNSVKLIEDLHTAAIEYHGRSIKIVCVVPDPEAILASRPDISDLEHLGKITFVKGDIRNKEVAYQSNAFSASSIILTAEDTTKSADEKTLLRALSVTKYIRKKCEELGVESSTGMAALFESHETQNDITSTYIIAEINNEEYIEDLRNAGVNGIVDRGQITKNILIQSLLNPGVSVLLNNILSFSDDTNEFYTVDLREEENQHLRFKTFDELILPLRKQSILLLAIKVVYLDRAGRVIVDVDELDKLLQKDKLGRQIITNPINEVETQRKTDADDHLIVLAASSVRLKEGLAKVDI